MSLEEKISKYVIIAGGVISGVGKGIVTASVANLLESQGYSVAVVKIDPYVNIDAGTMRPTEHGEVFVTEDGFETDQDLGHYERFTNITTTKDNSITTGQIYQAVINKERNLAYGGKCVEVIPHISGEAKERIKSVAKKTKADFTLVEIGGTIGDYQNVLFFEAIKSIKQEGEPVTVILTSYLPIPKKLGEMKTKPTQHAARMLMEYGLLPDFIIGRSEKQMDNERKNKIARFCNVKLENVISSPDVESIYEVPVVLRQQEIDIKILYKFNLRPRRTNLFKTWKESIKKIKTLEEKVKIGIIGKYFDTGGFVLKDSYISVIEAIKHASWHNNLKPDIKWVDSKEFEKDRSKLPILNDFDGIVIPGGFGTSGIEGKILAIQYAREKKIPFLGLCYGMQLAVIEYARNICGLKNANTTEINKKTKYPVVDVLPEQKKIVEESRYGATMRLGAYPAVLKKGSIVRKFYGRKKISERHRHRYEVNPKYIKILEKNGLVFSGKSPDRTLMEFLELPEHPFFVATQSHPEFKSRFLSPSPIYNGLIKAAHRR